MSQRERSKLLAAYSLQAQLSSDFKMKTSFGFRRLITPASPGTGDVAFTLVRVAAGLIMIPHGIPKLFGSFAPIVASKVLGPLAIPFPLVTAYGLGVLEIVGGCALAAGVMTRLFASAFAIEVAVIALFVSWPKGWIYSVPGGGAEFPSLLFAIYVAISIAGGGDYSYDSVLQRRPRKV